MELSESVNENRPSAKKAQRQSSAKAKMVKEDNKMRKEREEAKVRVEEIDEILKTSSTQKREVPILEDEKRILENKLAMFEVDDD